MRGIAQWIRTNVGRKAIEPAYATHITEQGKILSDIYHLSYETFDVEKGEKEKKEKREVRPVIWGDAEQLVTSVADHRDIGGNLFIKVMADDGQRFLKICMTILPPINDPELDRAVTEDEDASQDEYELKKRSTYKEGGGIGQHKQSSVKRVVLLCLVPKCKETHSNMKKLIELTNLNRISFLFVSDLKLLLITLGCQCSSSSFPCPYCLVPKKHLGSSVDENDWDIVVYEERTFGSIDKNQQLFTDIYSSDVNNAKFCNSAIRPSLIVEADDVRVLDKCPPEELHCLQGFVNHTFWNGLVKVMGSEENALKFPKKAGAIPKDYHGKVFEGNACRTMLQKVDKLLDGDVLGDTSIVDAMPYVRAYKAMDKLVHACFSCRIVTEDIAELLKEVIISYMDLGVTVTPKMHVIFYHILPALKNPLLEGRGLGMVSGQDGESIHCEFKTTWEKYKINSLENKLYGEHLLKAVIEFSSKHP